MGRPAISWGMLRVGAHTSIAKSAGPASGAGNAVHEQVDVGGSCGQIFTRSPQVWADPDIGDAEAAEFRELTADAGIAPWVVHSSYLVNLATPDEDLRRKSVASLQADVDAADRLGVRYVNVHLGAHTGAGVEAGLANAAGALDELAVPDDVTVLVESDAGSGTKLGGDFGHLAAVLERCSLDLAVCLDTAHAFAAGYDLSTPAAVDATVAAFDEVVGREHLAVVHLNDSKHGCGTSRDEHAHVGEGEIGDAGMAAVVNHDALRDLPFVLETPHEDGRGFAWNVERVHELRE